MKEPSCPKILGKEVTWSGLCFGSLSLVPVQRAEQRKEWTLEARSPLGGEC